MTDTNVPPAKLMQPLDERREIKQPLTIASQIGGLLDQLEHAEALAKRVLVQIELIKKGIG